MLCPSNSLLPVYADKYLYVVHLNKMIYGNNYMKTKVISSNAKAYLRSVQYCTYGYLMLQDLCYELLREM